MNVKDLLRRLQNDEKPESLFQVWNQASNTLQQKFSDAKNSIHLALCDNIDTRTVLDVIRDLVGLCNVYIRDHSSVTGSLNILLLKRIATYITDILHIFGVITGPRGGIGFPVDSGKSTDVSGYHLKCVNIVQPFIFLFVFHFQTEETVIPYLSALAEFRNSVREVARSQKCAEILNICDALRDDILPNLGVRLEDREGAAASIKLVDRDTLLKERDEKKKVEAEKQALKEKKRQEAAAAAAALEAQRKTNPKEMFLNETDKYSAFDERGIPTLDVKGEKISKGLTKKLEKLQIAQEKKYNEYLASQNNGS